MDKLALIFLSGLYTLHSCIAHKYHFVNNPKSWTEAQSYCREHYSDLATIDNMEDMETLVSTVVSGHKRSIWIGLYNDLNSWRWSLDVKDYYEGEDEFRNWDSSDNKASNHHCVVIGWQGTWWDDICSTKYLSVCYDGRATDISKRFILVNEIMTWDEAQSYCKKTYTDLAIVRNLVESINIGNIVPKLSYAWIGLHRDWSWSDQSESAFRYWLSGKPDNRYKTCVSMSNYGGKWEDYPCETQLPFSCYSVPVKKQQVVSVRLNPKEWNMDLTDHAVQEAILQQIKTELKKKGMSDYINLRWKMQRPDGKVFHKE